MQSDKLVDFVIELVDQDASANHKTLAVEITLSRFFSVSFWCVWFYDFTNLEAFSCLNKWISSEIPFTKILIWHGTHECGKQPWRFVV